MGTDVTEIVEALPSPRNMKVHHLMCTELITLVDRVSKLCPEIEEARPRWSGMQTLCLLIKAIEKANLLLQYCSESSKLYLALTGDAIQSRCKKARSILEHNLSQIQNMVPVMLAAKISQLISDLRRATFSLDPGEEEAGKVLRALLQQYASANDSKDKSTIESIKFAAFRLHITSQKAVLIEQRSIKMLLNKVGDDDPNKKQILSFFLNLLTKYRKLIVRQQAECAHVQHEDSFSIATSCDEFVDTESRIKYRTDEAQADLLRRPVPPEEFKCPISLRLMYDPVVIASGQTFERMWIQKWFDEGNDTCPKTERKLAALSTTPNTTMKHLISKWCTMHGITISDPYVQSAAVHSLETSSISIASLSSSIKDLYLPVDLSNVSLGSLDGSHNSDSSHFRITDGVNFMSMKADDDTHELQSGASTVEADMNIFLKLDALPWESQCKVVEDMKSNLKRNDQAFHVMSSRNFVDTLLRFLKEAYDLHDLKAQRTGCLLFLAFVSNCRHGIQYLREDAYGLLALFLDSELTEEALSILEGLSQDRNCRSKIATSGALTCILKILDIREFQEPSIKTLYNLSLNSEIHSLIVSLEFIPKLVPFFEDDSLARYCVKILKNLCDIEDARISVAETDGCIASIAKLLEMDSHEDQEHAVSVLLSLCSQRDHYCQLIMDEGVIPALVCISVNGNDKGKATAMELLRLLRGIEYKDVEGCPVSDLDFSREDSYKHSKVGKKSSKSSGFFRKMSIFSELSSLTPKRKK